MYRYNGIDTDYGMKISAATMAFDIGLGRKPRNFSDHNLSMTVGATRSSNASHPIMSPTKQLPDSSSLESRRTLLACYTYCARYGCPPRNNVLLMKMFSASLSLRLPNMLAFTNWMAESVEVLATSPDAAPTDKRFLAWVKLQRIVEESCSSIGLNNPGASISLAEERVQIMLRNSERQLEDWRRSVSSDKGIMNSMCKNLLKFNGPELSSYQAALRLPTMLTMSTYTRLLFILTTTLRTSDRRSSFLETPCRRPF